MTEFNPFGDVEREAAKAIERQLEVVLGLDRMERDVSSWEADFLSRVLVKLRDERRALTQREIEIVNEMCEKYDTDDNLA